MSSLTPSSVPSVISMASTVSTPPPTSSSWGKIVVLLLLIIVISAGIIYVGVAYSQNWYPFSANYPWSPVPAPAPATDE